LYREIESIYDGIDDLTKIADDLFFTKKELNALIPVSDTNGDDDIPEVIKPITKLGDIWILGNHRVLCGDSTKEDDFNMLMDGKKADMVFTDPPYNKDYKYNTYKDKKEDYWGFLGEIFENCDNVLKNDSSIYIKQHIMNIFENYNITKYWNIENLIMWQRISQAHPKNNYDNAFEPIMFYKKGNPVFNTWAQKRESIDSLIDSSLRDGKEFKGKMWNKWDDIKPITGGCIRSKESTSDGGFKDHPAQMPIGIAKRAIEYSSNDNGICIDVFWAQALPL